MDPRGDIASARRGDLWAGTGLLLLVVPIGVWLARSPNRESALLGALVTSAGNFGMAWLASWRS